VHASFAVLTIGISSDPQVRQATFFRPMCAGGELLNRVEKMFDPFFACDPAMEGAVLDRVGLSFVVRMASDFERVVVALRCRVGRERCGSWTEDVFLQRVNKCMFRATNSECLPVF
jgi:hypothetical protein